MQVNEITDSVIGAAIEVHRALGPGLLESAYVQLSLSRTPPAELALPPGTVAACEMQRAETRLRISGGHVVADTVVVEVKAVERLAPVHEAQLLTYLRLGGWKIGLLVNFNVPVLRDSIVRRVFGLVE